ncbi:sensor histidine kinase [Flavivirga aquimarina]|uniref:Oxygen sensor histidine kinase NreB n=1 Tax=Flavivirga aquimarina TaxID=2027862 RepID=A0ABT8W9V4_9FLAO|nr:sensor histidine kinase [Flavivirga aquimarina]MDO5969925.1 sensor histidine kinase [Flavivirga aquimarina]
MIKKSLIILLTLCFKSNYGQNDLTLKIIDSSLVLYQKKEHNKAINLLEESLINYSFTANEKNKIYYELYKNSYWINKNSSKIYLHKSKANYQYLSNKEKAKLNYGLGNIHRVLNKYNDSAIYYFLSSLKFLDGSDNLVRKERTKLYQKLANTYSRINNKSKYYYYLNKNLSDLLILKDTNNLVYNYNNLGTYFSSINNIDSSLFYYKKAIKIKPTSKISGSILQNIGGIYLGQLKNIDSAEYYFNEALKYNITKEGLTSLYFNKAVINRLKNKVDSTIYYYSKAEKYADTVRNIKMKSYVSEDLSNFYESLKKYDKALAYRKQFEILNDSVSNLNLLKKVEEYNIKYETEKKEKENIQLQTNIEKEQRQKRNLLMGALTLLLFISIMVILIYKNTKRKQKLAEQEKALETQKLATVLKEQELISIDAMIEGQEKERQRIANDLHDDLGGLMATVKLHFNVFKDKQTPELFDKTTKLIDEAYQKIRSIAHAKNSGVIAKQGLLKAIQNMADKISVSNKISIYVVDHELEDRLENSLELTIFRIIQELVTNIIKHANATEATIHLTNHKDRLNIMVEDNGKGFDHSQITTKNKGMGISSIDKRIDHLNGTMTIESEINKGTTIIIDIPI